MKQQNISDLKVIYLLHNKARGFMEIRECNECDWLGWSDDCVHPKHLESLSLCPECQETTFVVTPEYISELKSTIEERCG